MLNEENSVLVINISLQGAECGAEGVEARAGRDAVDPDTAGAELSGPGLRQRPQGGLGRTVRGPSDQAETAGHAADVNDAPGTTGGHMRRECRDQIELCADIGGKHRIEGGDLEVRGPLTGLRCG